MITEGRGRHAPKPIIQQLNKHAIWLCFDAAASISRRREYAKESDQWKQGLTGGLMIHGIGWLPRDAAPRFIGCAGEAAAICFLNDRAGASLSLDDHFLKDGDGGIDINIWGLTAQVKTRQSGKSHSRERLSLIRCKTGSGRDVFPKATTINCCELNVTTCEVLLLGWFFSVRAKELPPMPARQGNHMNIELPDIDLEPMGAFVDLAIARKGLA